MTDRGKEPAPEESRSLDALWVNQSNIIRQLDELAAEVQRLSIEVRREFNLIRARQQPQRNEPPINRTVQRRGIVFGRQNHRDAMVVQESSDSGEESPTYPGA
ncbi:hypothetical protein KFK09_006637 [Dendrobium nobile]|uniref:Uncharacterized protein n=1 Tax=Dendrobium nobile TaxID=94219 RepID=A0A8T3BPP9_DENNO|nr:hypothetical protein KFK09_006637 [Dendrobium nobile]